MSAATENDHPPVTLTSAFEARVDEVITHYPASKRSAALPLLHLWQEEFGYVSTTGVEWIAKKLSLQPIHILELVTFYPMFRQHPAGKIQFKVCRTLSCALAGAYQLRDYLATKCQVGTPDSHGLAVSPNHQYSVEFVECLASCGTGPCVMVNDDFFENVTQAKADELIRNASRS